MTRASISPVSRSRSRNAARPRGSATDDARRPRFGIYPGDASDRDRGFLGPAFFAPRAAFAPLGYFVGAVADLPDFPCRRLPFWRCEASSGSAWSSEKVSGSAVLGKDAMTPSWLT